MGDVIDLFPEQEPLQCFVGEGEQFHQFPITLLENVVDGVTDVREVDSHLIKCILAVFIDLAYEGVFDNEL